LSTSKKFVDAKDPLARRRSANNPYLTAFELILDRLKWDMHPEAWISRKKLKIIKNSYCGKRAVILCNGPSLLKVNFKKLENSGVYTFGLNKINLLFDRESFRPDCIVSVNSLVLEQNADFFNSTNIELFVDSYAKQKGIIENRKNITYLHSSGVQRFAKDVSISISQGYTVTFVALQLAFHMGFQEVAIIGADHSYSSHGTPNKMMNSDEVDKSHFDPSYFSGGMKWHFPDIFESEVWYGRAQNMYKAHGRCVFNCTEGGELEVFPRSSLSDFLSK